MPREATVVASPHIEYHGSGTSRTATCTLCNKHLRNCAKSDILDHFDSKGHKFNVRKKNENVYAQMQRKAAEKVCQWGPRGAAVVGFVGQFLGRLWTLACHNGIIVQ